MPGGVRIRTVWGPSRNPPGVSDLMALRGRRVMVTEVLNRRASATDMFPPARWSATAAKMFRSKELWAVVWSTGMAVMLSLGLAYATVDTGIDLTIGSTPIDSGT